jgi:MFS family permease
MLTSARLRVFGLFALGYFVSYLFRGVNLGFAPLLTREMGLSAVDLGALTSLYFLGFAIAQLPGGVLLDHFGPRRGTAGLLWFAAIGASVFGMAHSFVPMMIGRLLIGVGVSICLGGAFKALAEHFPLKQLPLVNGLTMAVGGLGGVAVGSPLSWLLSFADWRSVCVGLAFATSLVAIALWFGVPDAPRPSKQGSLINQLKGTHHILRSAAFWRAAAFSGTTQGVFYGMQSLWVGAFLRDVSGFGAARIAELVSVIGIAMMAGCAGFGALARRFEKYGVSLHVFCGITMGFFVLDQILIMLQVAVPAPLLWAAYGALGSSGILSYAVLAEHFPPHMIGRATTAFTLVIFLLIFAFQIGVGFVLNIWQVDNGHYPASAHLVAWGVLLALQVAGAIWHSMPSRRSEPAAP